MAEFTHFDESGASRMVDVSAKAVTLRKAVARGSVTMQAATAEKIRNRQFAKGDVLEVARLAGIMAAKHTGDLIPLCHPLPLEAVEIAFDFVDEQTLSIQATTTITAKTGVEMEALAAVSVAALTVYDMCKSIDRGMSINDIRLVDKSGGQSGDFKRTETPTRAKQE